MMTMTTMAKNMDTIYGRRKTGAVNLRRRMEGAKRCGDLAHGTLEDCAGKKEN